MDISNSCKNHIAFRQNLKLNLKLLISNFNDLLSFEFLINSIGGNLLLYSANRQCLYILILKTTKTNIMVPLSFIFRESDRVSMKWNIVVAGMLVSLQGEENLWEMIF